MNIMALARRFIHTLKMILLDSASTLHDIEILDLSIIGDGCNMYVLS